MIKGVCEEKKEKDSKCPQNLDKWFAKTSTNEILIRLLFCSSLVGSIIILLWGAGTHPKLDEFVFAISGGTGAGIMCSLFFTSNTLAPGVLGSLPIVGSSTKVLFGFFAGMFSGKI